MNGHDLGKGLSIVVANQRANAEAYEDLARFHAPSECHADVARWQNQEERTIRKRVKSVTGLRWSAFWKECERRTSPATIRRVAGC